jgi:hypothetical protein
MASTLAVFCVAFAAFCVWLGVRIVNRRERWAKRNGRATHLVAAASGCKLPRRRKLRRKNGWHFSLGRLHSAGILARQLVNSKMNSELARW